MKRILVGSGLVAVFATVRCVGLPRPCQTDADCAPHDYCEKTLAGGSCVALYESIAIRHPADGIVLGGGTQTLDVELIAYSGLARRDPPAIPYSIRVPDGGLLAQGDFSSVGAGRYQSGWTPGPEGPYELTVSFQSLEATSQFQVDRSAPELSIRIPAPPASARPGGLNLVDRDTAIGFSEAWRRDETLPVEVRSNASDVDTSNVDVIISGIAPDGGVGAPQPAVKAAILTSCDASYCGLAQMSLWQPQMYAFRGEMLVQVIARDWAGNTVDAGAWAKVTRWRWDYDTVSPAGIKTSPAIGSNGRIYFGPANAARIHALTPSGAVAWSSAMSSAASSVAVGTPDGGFEILYVGTAGTTGGLVGLNGSNGNAVATCSSFNGDIQAGLSIGMVDVGTPSARERAVALLNGATTGRLINHSFSGTCDVTSSVPNSSAASSIVMQGPRLYYGDPNGFIRAYIRQSGQWYLQSGWPADAGLASHALAISGTEIIGGGTGGPGTGGVFAIPTIGGVFWKLSTASESWSPAIRGTNQIIIGLADGSLQSVPIRDSLSSSTIPINGVSKGAPIIARNNFIYLASDSYVHALDATSLSRQWYVYTGPSVEASLAIDCIRDTAGRPIGGRSVGVLYVPSMNGHLYAFIVDSAGLDTTSAWPKYQHDPRNTGNADTNLAQFACP